jgi:hypothetical protein
VALSLGALIASEILMRRAARRIGPS